MSPPPRIPARVSNPISLAGIVVATTMALLFFVLLTLEIAGAITNPYIGLVMFVTVPVIFVVGLLLIPIGAWWSARRKRLHPDASDWPLIDLGNPHHRRVTAAVAVLTLVNLAIVSLAAYGGVHYMDSSEFCGEVCHTTMEPEYVSYKVWPHAKVECAKCHVGPGARALVQAKMAGTRQLYHVITNQVPKPVPPPAQLIRPNQETCAQCHWPEKFHGDKIRVIREYANDETNTESTTTLRLHVGGGSSASGNGTGIHWHMNVGNKVEFVDGGDGTIPYVRVTDQQGRMREFVATGADASALASMPRQQMECMDCHNRPAHTMFYTPERAVDTVMAQGRIPRDLPFARREALAAVKGDYPTRDAAMAAIDKHLTTFYAAHPGADPQAIRRAVTGTQQLWRENVFPAMNVKWGTYPNNIGHLDSPGCFRCHDDEHKAADGTVIKQDCELCHTSPE